MTVNDKVSSWADISGKYIPGTVVGNIEVVTLTDERLGNYQTRNIRIWTPSNYDPSDFSKKYPVIYMHDGQNLFDEKTSFTGEWEVDETIETLIKNNNFDGVIVVGIDNTSERFNEYTYNYHFLDHEVVTNKTGDKYLDFIVDVVKVYVDQNYQTKPDRKNTTIAGSSLGGLISLFGGLARLDVFGNILAFSTSTQFVIEESKNVPLLLKTLDNDLLKDTNYFFYVGTSSDGDINWPDEYKSYLLEEDVLTKNIKTLIGDGYAHNEHAWKTHFPNAIKWLYKIK